MALQTSGQISIEDIYIELKGVAPQSDANVTQSDANVTLEDLCTGVVEPLNPDSTNQPTTSAPFDIQSWYGYDHSESSGTSAGSIDVYFANVEYGTCGGGGKPITVYYDSNLGLKSPTLSDLANNKVPIYRTDSLTNMCVTGYYLQVGLTIEWNWNGREWMGSVRCNAS